MRQLMIAVLLVPLLSLGCSTSKAWEFSEITYGDWYAFDAKDKISLVKEYKELHGIDVINSVKEIVQLLNETAEACAYQDCVENYMNNPMDKVLSGLTTMAVLEK